MTDTSEQFDQFLSAIELKQKQVDRIESARNSLTTLLKDWYDITDDEVFVQGSYANNTAVRPIEGGEYDIDIVVVSADDDDGATDAIRELFDTLEDSRYKDKIEERKPCVRVKYADEQIGGFHVDVIPLRVSSSDEHDAPYEAPRKGSGWHGTAPAEYTDWCTDQGEQFQRTVMMFKRWRDEQQDVRKAVKSIVLQVLISQYMPVGIEDDAGRVAATFVNMHDALKDLESAPEVLNPSLDSEDLAARWSDADFANFKTELEEAAEIASEASSADTLVEACEKWNEIFGDAFPVVTSEKLSMRVADTSHARDPVSRGWVVALESGCSVRIIAQTQKGRRGRLRNYPSGGAPIFASRRTSLRFRAIASGHGNAMIWWRVTNTGAHARQRGTKELRGDFFKGRTLSGSESPDQFINYEQASYTGSHLIEAFVVQGRRVIGQSAPFVVNVFSASHPMWRP
ncbi:MAG: nucleotidyltransferase [Mycolicibacterium rufum]|nr:nucleotidyltransferase [Mycolicibacterium rufum]